MRRMLWIVMALLLAGCSEGAGREGIVAETPAVTVGAATLAAADSATAATATLALDAEPEATAPVQPTVAAVADDAPTTAAEPGVTRVEEALAFEGAEGLAIAATLYKPAGDGRFPGVILLHMLGSESDVWVQTGLVDALVGAGYAALAVDLRGHGATGGTADWALAEQDVGLVWDAFAARDDIDGQRTAAVGASIGANLALRLGAARPGVRGLVLLSPGLDYRGVVTEDAIEGYGERPLLIVASGDDEYAADSAASLNAWALGDSEFGLYAEAGHGTDMFAKEPDLASLIVAWLDDHLAAQ